MRGKTISIYIPDANPQSIKMCEITDSIVKWLYIPRNKLNEALKREELQHPWIYFLIGDKNEIGKHEIYIWETETLITRLKQHNSAKEFWNIAICFMSEKLNSLNKAHIKYLENYCCSESKRINRCSLINNTNPTQSRLKESEQDFALSFFDDLKIIIATLWFPIFEEIKSERKNVEIFFCKGKDASAEWEYNENWLTVYKWSKANLEETNTVSWISELRKNLIEKWILNIENNILVFTEDYTFSSPSAAAAAVLWRSANWRSERKNNKKETLDEIIRQK